MGENSQNLPVVEQDPTDASFVADPYPFYAELRAIGDFVFWANYDLPVATTHAAVSEVLRHPSMGRAVPEALATAPNPALAKFTALERHSLLELEPPDHTRIRREAMSAFTGPQIALIGPRISQIADALIDGFPDTPFDLIEAYSKPLAAQTITAFLGIDTSHAPQLQAWSNSMVAMYQARRDAAVEAEAETAARAFTGFITDVIAERRAAPGSDFISQLAECETAGTLTADEVVSTVILLLNAGHEATVHAVGNAVPQLLGFEGLKDALEPDSIAGTVEECLRFRPPLHLFKRFVYQPTTIAGVHFAPNNEIGCLLASACHDDAVWPDARVFDPFRPRIRHLAFGLGLHACVGAALARLEMQIALPILFARCPGLTTVEQPTVANLFHFHGYERLMVSVR